jgi:hypothetical protein
MVHSEVKNVSVTVSVFRVSLPPQKNEPEIGRLNDRVKNHYHAFLHISDQVTDWLQFCEFSVILFLFPISYFSVNFTALS